MALRIISPLLCEAKKRQNSPRVKYWEIIADNLSKAGWSWGCVATVDARGQTIFVADAHQGDNQRFIVRADERLTAFAELELAVQTGEQVVRPLDFFRVTESRISDNMQ